MTAPAPSPAPSRALLALAEAKVPRYTSYPTAAQFGPLDEATYRGWLRDGIRPDDPLSLYLHVPYCRDLCWYCACHAKPTRSEARIDAFAAALEGEADLLAAALPEHGGVSHLHLGGGTPSILGPVRMRALVNGLLARFGQRPGAELAIELDPRILDEGMVDTLGELGFTRASLGVQDISPAVQARIGRPQPSELIAVAVDRLRRAGIAGVNLDLMYGLPGQTVAHVEASARFAAWLEVDRVAVFGYAHVAWMKPNQKAIDAATLPGPEARLEQAEAAERVLSAAGYVALGLDHFARPRDSLARAAAEGRLRRNFQGYTTDDAPVRLGLGPSAIGQLPGGLAGNILDERAHADAVAEGHLPVARGVATTAEDLSRGALIERLMCDFALDLGNTAPSMQPAIASALAAMAPLRDQGLVELTPGRVVVTPQGRRFVRQVAACFDAYLAPSAQRHSAAV
ncbi:oxygen-independent coproporphyrinogen III oxidase [Roseomonas sp. KE2513]|uniref:oxygen-independent coproporphyrinogen III oxidase n=1 Tax=Roseomonas sp. KE2513 TaxID=2479202 RepID=UPI0018DF531B|nr:oxygen-independent coproporphyrinogen III oxidase [Roseomonas sp. KE2513]MBI0539614.1 oxygen-independent coproporphyrinogen III oxidase [Roseomonas sp. KE2513]